MCDTHYPFLLLASSALCLDHNAIRHPDQSALSLSLSFNRMLMNPSLAMMEALKADPDGNRKLEEVEKKKKLFCITHTCTHTHTPDVHKCHILPFLFKANLSSR